MVAYTIDCTVCNSSFSTRTSWHLHLLQAPHQSCLQLKSPSDYFSMKEEDYDGANLENNLKAEIQECGLVVFATFPVACVEVIDALSMSSNSGVFVTNFLPHPQRSRVGIFLFESREVLNQVYRGTGPQLNICNQVVQIQRCCDFLPLAWSELFSFSSEACQKLDCLASPAPSLKEEISTECLPVKNFSYEKASVPSAEVAREARPPDNGNCKSRPNTEPAYPQIETMTAEKEKMLMKQCLGIMRKMQMSPSVSKGIDIALELVRKLLATQFSSSAVVYKYRDCGLGLDSKMPYFYMDTRIDKFKESRGLLKLLLLKNTTSSGFNFETTFGIPTDKLKLVNMFSSSSNQGHERDYAYELTFQANSFSPSPITVCVSLGSKYLLEAETDRLIRYLLTFDRRASSLLKLFRYCLKANSLLEELNLVQLKVGPELAPVIYSYPNRTPSACEMLVVFFLAKINLIPSPSYLLGKAQQANISSRIVFDTDIDFISTTSIRDAWTARKVLPKVGSKAFVLQVLGLAKELFKFCSELASPPSSAGLINILNIKHGELLSTNTSHPSSLQISTPTKLTKAEVGKVCKVLRETTSPLPTPSTVLLHPLIVQACFLLSASDQCLQMSQLSENLSQLIFEWKAKGGASSTGGGPFPQKANMDLWRALKLQPRP